MLIKDLHPDVERYLLNDCYCQHEIYSFDGFCYQLFYEDQECEKIGEIHAENDDMGIVESIDAFQRKIELFDFLVCVSCVHCMRAEKDIRRIVRLNKEVHKHLLPFFCI